MLEGGWSVHAGNFAGVDGCADNEPGAHHMRRFHWRVRCGREWVRMITLKTLPAARDASIPETRRCTAFNTQAY
jgi:hypothetical protein